MPEETAHGSQTLEGQQARFVLAPRFSVFPSVPASLCEPNMRLDLYLPPSAVSFSYWERDLTALNITNTVLVCFPKLRMASVAKEGDLSYIFLFKSKRF